MVMPSFNFFDAPSYELLGSAFPESRPQSHPNDSTGRYDHCNTVDPHRLTKHRCLQRCLSATGLNLRIFFQCFASFSASKNAALLCSTTVCYLSNLSSLQSTSQPRPPYFSRRCLVYLILHLPPQQLHRPESPPRHIHLPQPQVGLACTEALTILNGHASNPSGTSACYNIHNFDNTTGAFQSDLRLYRIAAPIGNWMRLSSASVDVRVKFDGASDVEGGSKTSG